MASAEEGRVATFRVKSGLAQMLKGASFRLLHDHRGVMALRGAEVPATALLC
jgi:hypothetical protein